MPQTPRPLSEFIDCEKIDVDLYKGQSRDFKTGQVYGGQVLGQAIRAAYDTVLESRHIRSAHAYFLRPGDVEAPIVYEIDRSMEGRSVSSRRVVAKQHGKQIFHLSASFQECDDFSFDWQDKVNVPTHLLEDKSIEKIERKIHFQTGYLRLLDVEPELRDDPNSLQFFAGVKDALPDDRRLHESVMAYMSDMGVLLSAAIPLGLESKIRHSDKRVVRMISIDHAIWFHRPFTLDDWVYLSCRSQSSTYGRSLGHSKIYNTKGELLVSTAQEGMFKKA